MKVNWQRLALNIRKHTSLAKAAKRVGMDQATLQRIARGDTEEPKFSNGANLLDLHVDLEGREKTEALRVAQ